MGMGVGEECTCEKAAKPVTAVYDNISTFFSVKALDIFDQSLQHFTIFKCDTTGYYKGDHWTISSHVCDDKKTDIFQGKLENRQSVLVSYHNPNLIKNKAFIFGLCTACILKLKSCVIGTRLRKGVGLSMYLSILLQTAHQSVWSEPFLFFPMEVCCSQTEKEAPDLASHCSQMRRKNSLLFHAFAQNYSHSQLATWIQCRWAFMGQFMSVESGCQTVIFHSPGGKFEPYYLFLYSGCMEMCHLIVHGYYEYDMNTVWLWRSLGPTQAPFHLYSLKQTVLSSLVC